jgi:hypothetical protein
VKLKKVEAALNTRESLIYHVESELQQIFARWGSHESRETREIAIEFVDGLDWDEIRDLIA